NAVFAGTTVWRHRSDPPRSVRRTLRGLPLLARGSAAQQATTGGTAETPREDEGHRGGKAEDRGENRRASASAAAFARRGLGGGEIQGARGTAEKAITHRSDDGSGGCGPESGILASDSPGRDQTSTSVGSATAAAPGTREVAGRAKERRLHAPSPGASRCSSKRAQDRRA